MGENSSWNAGRILSTSSGYWHGCTLHAGVRLGVFSLLGEESLSASAIAAALETDARATEFLLNALSAMGLLEKENDLFSNTSVSLEFLAKDSPKYLGYIIQHHHHLVDGWAQMHDAVKYGKPVSKRSHGEERERESFLMGMFNLASGIAPKVAKEVPLADKKYLLDLGGGPGTYAIHFCLANPELKATIFDRQTTEPFARKTVEKFGLSTRIDFAGGDFNTDPIGGNYDAAWLSHILHSNGPDECQELVNKTAALMESGGVILVHEFILEESKDAPVFPALFSLNMLINNDKGRSYSEGEITNMLNKAGFNNVERLPFVGPNDSGIIRGVKA